MNRAFALLASLILLATPISGCLSGEDIEDLVDDLLGCMDENAENYDENATAEALGDCIYLVSMQTFLDKMEESMDIDAMLEKSPKAGFSYHLEMTMEDMGMTVESTVQRTVKVDLANSSAYLRMNMDMAPYMSIDYAVTQVGEVINVDQTISVAMAGTSVTSSAQTRDNDPDIMQLIHSFDESSSEGTGEAGIEEMEGLGEIPTDVEPVISWDSKENMHVLELEYFDSEANLTFKLTITLAEDEELISFIQEATNDTTEMYAEYTAIWGDAIVISIDETLPRTALPIDWLEDESANNDDWSDFDDDGSGDEIYWIEYGHCEWEGYEDAVSNGDDERWWCKIDESDEDWEEWWFYCEFDSANNTWFCTDDFGQSPDHENSANGTAHLDEGGSDEDEWTMNHFWGCGLVNVLASSLDDFENETIDSGVSAHPDFPDWCGEVVGVEDLPPVITDGDPTFDSANTRWAVVRDGTPQLVTVSEDTFLIQFAFMTESDCESNALLWDSDESMCGNPVPITMEMDDTMQAITWPDGSTEYIRYEFVGDHLFIAFLNPTIEEPAPEPQTYSATVDTSQIFNAPISDFEFRAIDCSEVPPQYDEMGEETDPLPSDCDVLASATLSTTETTMTVGSDSWATFVYEDNDGDGMISTGDVMTITTSGDVSWDTEIFDTWADEYTSESSASNPMLPGFGGLLAAIGLLGAAMASRRD